MIFSWNFIFSWEANTSLLWLPPSTGPALPSCSLMPHTHRHRCTRMHTRIQTYVHTGTHTYKCSWTCTQQALNHWTGDCSVTDYPRVWSSLMSARDVTHLPEKHLSLVWAWQRGLQGDSIETPPCVSEPGFGDQDSAWEPLRTLSLSVPTCISSLGKDLQAQCHPDLLIYSG